MKNKYTILIIILLFLIIGGYFGYKIFNLYYYDMDDVIDDNYEDFLENLYNKDTIVINTKLNNDDYLSFDDIKIKNTFQDFKKIEETNDMLKYVKYVLYDKNEKAEAAFVMGYDNTYINMFKEEVSVYGNNIKKINDKGLEKFLKENNITNDIELFEYLRKTKDIENNIFDSVEKMKNNYTIHLLSSMSLPSLENFSIIKGDYTGYIFNSQRIKEVSILKNNKRYIFTFINLDYFNDIYINELLDTIIID